MCLDPGWDDYTEKHKYSVILFYQWVVLQHRNERQCTEKPTTITWSGPESLLLLAGHSSLGDKGCCGGGLCWCSWSRRWLRAGRFQGPGLLFIILSGKILRQSEGAHRSGGDWSSLLLRCRRGPPCCWSQREKSLNLNDDTLQVPIKNSNSFESNVVSDLLGLPQSCWHCCPSLCSGLLALLDNCCWCQLGCGMSAWSCDASSGPQTAVLCHPKDVEAVCAP